MLALCLAATLQVFSADVLKARGFEVLEQIRREYYLPKSKLYAEDITADGKKSGPCFNWGTGVLLSALNSAAKLDARYKPWLREYADASRVYWNDKGPVPGYDVLPGPKPVDRYYDDNAWMVLALVETYEILGDQKYLDWAEESLKYVLSGWDEKLGGGIYWRESDKKSKNTCSNAPSAAACYAVSQYTKGDYSAWGWRILVWQEKLEDPKDGLYWDNIDLSGKIEKTKWSYNTGLVFRASAMAEAHFTKEGGRASDWRVSPKRAIAHWFDPTTGAVKDGGRFAHLLFEGLLIHSPSDDLKAKIRRALDYSYSNARNSAGRYADRWDRPFNPNQKKFALIDQASVARAFLFAAGR
ncbi:MAG: hypothetical protein H7Y17_15355 [Chlorobia bacterium]|nr:hypothetical protein [Fimbriimonadaceae bacterium]